MSGGEACGAASSYSSLYQHSFVALEGNHRAVMKGLNHPQRPTPLFVQSCKKTFNAVKLAMLTWAFLEIETRLEPAKTPGHEVFGTSVLALFFSPGGCQNAKPTVSRSFTDKPVIWPEQQRRHVTAAGFFKVFTQEASALVTFLLLFSARSQELHRDRHLALSSQSCRQVLTSKYSPVQFKHAK